jgi:NAD(P)-dependent dehydrogenase (short-subunit alcohol dehydrogenase family)
VERVVFLVPDKDVYVTGTELFVDGGFGRGLVVDAGKEASFARILR